MSFSQQDDIIMAGPPFVFGSVLVLLSQLVMFFLPRDDERDLPKQLTAPRSFQLQPLPPGSDLVVPLLQESSQQSHPEDIENP